MKFLPAFLACFLLGAASEVSRILDGIPVQWDKKQELSAWSGDNLRRFFAGFENAMADIYWLRSIQYHGGEVAFNPESKLDLLESYLDVTTTLDPKFEMAYRYGAIFLSEGRFGANTPLAGIRLLEKGLRAMPDNWRLAQDRALFTSVYLHDARRASQLAEESSRMPGAPAYLRVMAATFLADGDSIHTAREMWRQLTGPSEEPFVRAAAQRYLNRYDAIEMAARLTALVPKFREIAKRDPMTIQDFLAVGLFRTVPVDPTGTAFTFDPVAQVFKVNRASTLYLDNLEATVASPRSR